MKIIFMGTPDFAAPSLRKLIESNHQIVAVFTQKPKPKGRGLKEEKSPVQKLAESFEIPVFTPLSLKSEEAYSLLQTIEADVIIVVAYGFIIPQRILDLKKYGCLNVHPSLLPKYRGAAPLQHTILNGEKETAVCIMQMDAGLDTGDIILQKKFLLNPEVTLRELHDYCAKLGAELLLETLANIDTLPRIKQKEAGASYASKLSKEVGKINWQEDAYIIDCKIRGMNPWPGTYFNYKGSIVKIIEAKYIDKVHNMAPGTVMNEELNVACGKGSLKIIKLQQPGKKILEAAEYLKGTHFGVGEILSDEEK